MDQNPPHEYLVVADDGKKTLILISASQKERYEHPVTKKDVESWNVHEHRATLKVVGHIDDDDGKPGVSQRLVDHTTTAPLQPDDALIKLHFELNGEKIKEAIDGILMTPWDDVQKSHDRAGARGSCPDRILVPGRIERIAGKSDEEQDHATPSAFRTWMKACPLVAANSR